MRTAMRTFEELSFSLASSALQIFYFEHVPPKENMLRQSISLAHRFQFNMALDEIWAIVRRANKYIDEKTPWILAKDPERKAELDTVLRNLVEALRIVSILIIPYMHTTSERMREQLGLADVEAKWEDAFTFYQMDGCKVQKGEVLFPRLDIEKELDRKSVV